MQQNQPKRYQNSVPTMNSSGKRRWLYPDRRGGHHASRRRRVALVLIVIYLVLPWLTWHGIPLLRFDILDNKAFLFGQVFHLNDATLTGPFLMAAALTLFVATSLKGRIWCSYGCPQTVFVDWVIRPIEELTEGNAHHRRRMDQEPMTLAYGARKVVKHLLFLAVAAIVANTFLSFFFGPDRILHWMSEPPSHHVAPFTVMTAIMLCFYADLAWFREQFCAFVCPYARFQSVMFDTTTPAVAYDAKRGEPRGRSVKAVNTHDESSSTPHGDCIDCQLCVRVCPTGIDIRNGLQLECIMCARCIDACNIVMKNLERPMNLITIASSSTLNGAPSVPVWKRGKVIAYGLALTLAILGIVIRVYGRDDISVTLMRAPGPVYSQMPDGRLGNMFMIKVTNNTEKSIKLNFEVVQPEHSSLLCAQCQSFLPPAEEIRASAIVVFSASNANSVAVIREISSHVDVSAELLAPASKP